MLSSELHAHAVRIAAEDFGKRLNARVVNVIKLKRLDLTEITTIEYKRYINLG